MFSSSFHSVILISWFDFVYLKVWLSFTLRSVKLKQINKQNNGWIKNFSLTSRLKFCLVVFCKHLDRKIHCKSLVIFTKGNYCKSKASIRSNIITHFILNTDLIWGINKTPRDMWTQQWQEWPIIESSESCSTPLLGKIQELILCWYKNRTK